MTIANKGDTKVEKKVSPADHIIEKIKRRRLVTLAIVIGTITIAVGSFLGAVTKITEFASQFVHSKHRTEPTTVAELQNTVRTTAAELKQAFDSVTSDSGRNPPIPDSEFARVRDLITKIVRLDPENGHAVYYNGFMLRWQDQRPASHPALFLYLERAKDPSVHMPGDNGDAKFCFDNWRGYCKQRQAFINHFLAIDFEKAAKEEKDRAVALDRLKAALDRADTAIKLYGEFNAPGQGTPTRTLAASLRKQISKWEQPVVPPPLPVTPPAQKIPVQLSSCIGRGGLEGVHFWGPDGQFCNGIVAWGPYSEKHFEAPSQICSCKGHGGVEGVTLWGPEGAACAGISSWGTYNQDCASANELKMCSCVGHGNILEGHILWGPKNSDCGGFSSWGRYAQSCKIPQ